jgi:hypothetical protein
VSARSFLTTIVRAVALVALAMLAGACSDAATRVAYDIESGTKKLGSRDGSRVEISHVPSRWPEGCAGSYTLHLGKGSATADGSGNFRINRDADGLSVRCYNSSGNPHAWGTSYHLRFVDVPEAVEIEKQGGEATVIEVERKAGRAVVVGLH